MSYDAKKRRARYLANREAALAYRRKQHKRNKRADNERNRAWYQANRDAIAERKRILYNRRKRQHDITTQ